MAYCGPRGIPYEQWLGLSDGWTDFSRGCALAWQDREARRCGSCGQVNEDWLDSDGHELRIPPYQVVSHTCLGCESLELNRQDHDGKQPPYVHPRLIPVHASRPTSEDGGTVTG